MTQELAFKNEVLQLWQQSCDYFELVDLCCKDITYPDEIDEQRLEMLYRLMDETKVWQQMVLQMLVANDEQLEGRDEVV